MEWIWHEWLYRPLFNILIALYDWTGEETLGYAVIALTLVVRLCLLPVSIIAERGAYAYDLLQEKVRAVEKETSTDTVLKKERIRALLKEARISPWARVVVLGAQLLILVLLYQVFLGGINQQFDALYDWVQRPDYVNTLFLGFDVGSHNVWWAGSVGAILALEIIFSVRGRTVNMSDALYAIFFPLAVFWILWHLPIVKSLFVLTSMAFSAVLAAIRVILVQSTVAKKHAH